MSDPVREQVRQARQALDDATGAYEANLSDTVIVNRLWWKEDGDLKTITLKG